ncbi:MAG: TolC family protein [Candidatus Caldatribacteriota bacterium]|nr:TolC family protein [Candidatus Caldatribacteriota bacterium]
MRLKKGHFLGKIFFILILGSIILLTSQVFIFAASSPMKLNLEKSIQIALENNIGYKITESTVEISRAQVKEAEGAKKLNMKFRGGYLQMSETLDEEDMEAGDYSDLFSLGEGVPIISISATKILYSGGKLTSLIDQAEANKQISLNDLEKEKQEIIYKITEAYCQILQAEGMKKVSAQAVKQMQVHLGSSEALLKEGMIAPIDLNRIKSQLSNLEHNLIKAENGYQLMMYNLNSFMGIDLNTELVLENHLSYEPYEINLEQALIHAGENRIEIKNIIQQRKIMEEMFVIAKSNRKPQVILNAESGIVGWQATIVAEYSLLDGGVNKAKIEQAEINLAQVEQSEKQVRQLIEFEVRSAYLNMKEAEKLIKVVEEGIKNSQESFRIAQVKYNEGIATNTEVIDAQSTLIEAETNYLNALYNYNINRAALIKAMGTT